MAKVTQIEEPVQTPKKETTVIANGQSIVVTKSNVFDFLRTIVTKGFKESKAMTIKDGSLLNKHFQVLCPLKNSTEDETSVKERYQNVLNAISLANEGGAYDLNDADVINDLLSFIDENLLDYIEGKVATVESADAEVDV